MLTDEIVYIIHENTRIPCIIKRSKKRSSVALSVKPDTTVIVHAPIKTSLKKLQQIVDKNQVWITNKYTNAKRIYGHTQSSYADGDTALYLGHPYTLCYDTTLPADVCIEGDMIRVQATDTTSCRLAILAFYRKQAKSILTHRTTYWIPYVTGASEHTKLTLKHMKTRWGSMSTTGNMNLNIALIRTPMQCIDYVIVHELCHQAHPHHQKPFWDAVAAVMPDYKIHQNRLKQYPTEY